MKVKIDWFFLKGTLLFFLSAILFSSGLVIAGWYYESEKQEEFAKGRANLSTAHRLYTNMVNDIDLLEQYTANYSRYKSTGLVGGERRLSWIESLESTNSVLKLPALSYQLLPQEGFDRPGLTVAREVEVKSSPMKLDMSILHEEDLFALFDGLQLSIANLFTVDSCSVSLIGAVGEPFDTKSANFKSSCVVRWISIDVKA